MEGEAYQPERLWVEPSRTFMKGLTGATETKMNDLLLAVPLHSSFILLTFYPRIRSAVIGDVAYFGISAFGTRSERDSPSKTSEV